MTFFQVSVLQPFKTAYAVPKVSCSHMPQTVKNLFKCTNISEVNIFINMVSGF